MHTLPVTDRRSPIIWLIALAAVALAALLLSSTTGGLLAGSIALASGALAYVLTVFFAWRQRARRSMVVAHASWPPSRASTRREDDCSVHQNGVGRRLLTHAIAWLQAIVAALLFGVVLLAIGIPIALIVRAIADALAWAAGTR